MDAAQKEDAACQDVNEEDSRVVILCRVLDSIQDLFLQHVQIVVVLIRDLEPRKSWQLLKPLTQSPIQLHIQEQLLYLQADDQCVLGAASQVPVLAHCL